MPLTGTPRGGAATADTPRRIKLDSLLDSLDEDWKLLEQDRERGTSTPDALEGGLYYFFHTCVRPALYWIGGDPYTVRFPPEFEGERLAKACAYLKRLRHDDGAAREARERYVLKLRQTWPEYAALCTTYSEEVEETAWHYTWDGLDTLWSPADGDAIRGEDGKARALYLPKFGVPISEEWHLCCLVLLYLNRACNLRLSDLNSYGWGK